MYKKILLATDGSDHSIRAAEHAIKVAKMDQGQIDLIFVVDGSASKADVLHKLDKYEVKKDRERKLKPIIEMIEKDNIPYEKHFLHGEPGPTIVEFANKNDYDFVVVGSRGLNQVQTMILGSVSHKIAKRVECPVLIVK
ncbi:universal stress protein [Gracilibacillus sp. YIM 98692]|uniref:universal stress protein n=1 Tax=Gracilibacillus sp. YIM 98692 TaxID=2663532 RepID=UPI0013D85586|nr:universal stress protein [Gracilibacillus sp. YIM 98692]